VTTGERPPPVPSPRGDDETTATRLRTAPFEAIGRFADASNATLLVRLTDRDPRGLEELARVLGRQPELDDLDPDDLAVHKPQRGESPLWDFPDGTLHRREVAAYEVSAALRWDLVPVTVVARGGPFGVGSLQRFVPHDPDQHYFHLLEHGDDTVVAQLRAMVLFDLVIDNADRKGGHVLLEQPTSSRPPDPDEPRIRLVDHGVAFHVERKLRTVAWDLAGTIVPRGVHAALGRLAAALEGELTARLLELLSAAEVAVLRSRVEAAATISELPAPSGPRAYPWPLL
jgi:uncharacterized repeat protein (TIGR03843 family)